MKTYVFPGQGSQAKGMGGDLFDEFKDLTASADKILGYSIKELCLDDPNRQLNKTQFTQPALYVVNALTYYKKIKDTGVKPDYLAGHSLGEFNALLAAECFDFEQGLKLVKKRGELMSQAPSGGMAAILNSSKEDIEETLQKNGLLNIDLANYNTPSQIVISGDRTEIGKAESLFQHGDVLYYPLNTSGAFHSRFMKPSKEKFETYLKKFKFSEIKIPVLSNVTGLPYERSDIISNMANQLSSTVKWSESIQYLMSLGSDTAPMEFEEIGFGDVLTKIIDTIHRETVAKENTHKSNSVSDDSEEVIQQTTESKQSNSQEKNTVSSHVDNEHKTPPFEPADQLLSRVKEQVRQWNNSHPVGTKVKSLSEHYGELETRTEATVLFGHRAAVYMKGYKGYFDLDELNAIKP